MVYQVQISTDAQFKNLVVNKTVQDVTEYEVAKDLEEFGVYYWRVKAIDELTGAQSAWSEPCMFRVKAKDVIIDHSIDNPIVNNSYIWYGSNSFGLVHKFIRSYDTECEIPNAQIGVGIDNDSGDAIIGQDFCPGVCVPQFDGFELEILFTESDEPFYTEDGYMLVLEF